MRKPKLAHFSNITFPNRVELWYFMHLIRKQKGEVYHYTLNNYARGVVSVHIKHNCQEIINDLLEAYKTRPRIMKAKAWWHYIAPYLKPI